MQSKGYKLSLFIILLGLFFLSGEGICGDKGRKPASTLSLSDLVPKKQAVKKQSDREDIARKMALPPKVKTENQETGRITVEAVCTDSRRIVRHSSDPLYKDCLEERPRVANGPLSSTVPPALPSPLTPLHSNTTFGVRLSP